MIAETLVQFFPVRYATDTFAVTLEPHRVVDERKKKG